MLMKFDRRVVLFDRVAAKDKHLENKLKFVAVFK